ncbi:MAG: Ig-like domain-containing protein [Flavobacteriales bacterium]|nr:Ig-like domain-containing protein [Flavobacteriales bacterium]
MKKSYILGTLLIVSIGLTLNTFGQVKTIAEQELQVGSGVFFEATMDNGTSQLTMTMKGPDDRWFGVGFGLGMVNADVLIYTDGKVTATHALGATDYVLNATSAAGVSKDANDDWTIVSENAAAGVRTIVATRALNTGDTDDHILNFADATVNVIWAKGSTASNTLAYHGAGNKGTSTLTWLAPDVTEPALSLAPFSPADDQIDVAVATNLTATFDENIAAGIGNIELRLLSNDALVEAFDVTTNATFTGSQVSLNPAADLIFLENYYLVIPNGAIEDLAGNVYAGFSDNATWNFTAIDADVTEPALSLAPFSPADDQINVAVATNLTATFDENISAGSGNIELRLSSNDALVEAFDVTTNATFTGSQVSLNPAADLIFLENYYVVIPNGAIEDVAGNVYAGFSDNATWNFTAIDELSGISELSESFTISLNNSGDIVIANLTSEEYSVKLISINGQILDNIDVTSSMTIIKGDRFNNQSIIVQVITKNDSMSKLIKL